MSVAPFIVHFFNLSKQVALYLFNIIFRFVKQWLHYFLKRKSSYISLWLGSEPERWIQKQRQGFYSQCKDFVNRWVKAAWTSGLEAPYRATPLKNLLLSAAFVQAHHLFHLCLTIFRFSSWLFAQRCVTSSKRSEVFLLLLNQAQT